MTASIATRSEGNTVRPLNELVPLIKAEICRAEEAAEKAAQPHWERVGALLAEAREQMSASEFYSWAFRHFKIKETRAGDLVRYGKHLANTPAPRGEPRITPDKFRQQQQPSYAGYMAKPSLRREWTQPVDEIVAKAQREQIERIKKEALTRAQEKEAVRKLALRLIEIGYKVLAKELHPDAGGTKEAFGRLKQAHNLLKSCLGE